MRKNGWKLPCHPLQVVAVSVFLALGFAFYVFFAPFVGRKLFQYILIALYTPLITCVFGLYIWCAGADPADPGVFKSKKYLHISDKSKSFQQKDLKRGGQSTSSTYNAASAANSDAKTPLEKDVIVTNSTSKDVSETEKNSHSSSKSSCFLLVCSPCAFFCKCSSSTKESSEQQMSEEGMFYCSLCEVEVFKYSKHCRVCDKCVDRFDHHCRWLNNCIGRKNYRQFFTLMVASLLLLILQWSTGILVLICCFVERKHFSVDISSKLGSSFSLVPFVIVVAMCTILAMFATLPLAQLFFFHVLLIKKGISTYDYIIALREQEQEQQGLGGGPQSPQMSVMSSLTGLSSASSFNTFQHAAWCTPPRLFLEDQFDVVPPETGSVSSLGKMVGPETAKKRNAPAVKISSWTLARLNAEEVSKAATEARKKSKILQPVVRPDSTFRRETDSVVGSSDRQMGPRSDNNRRRATKRVRLPADLLDSLSEDPAKSIEKGLTGSSSISLLPLQLEARSAFQTSRAMAASSSPESSLDSPDIHPFRASLSGAEESRRLSDQNAADMASQKGIFPLFLRSTSDGYEASGGEDSDRVSSRIGQNERIVKLKPASSSGYDNFRKTGFNG